MTDGRVPLLAQEAATAAAEAGGVPVQLAELNVFRALLRTPHVAKPLTRDWRHHGGFGGVERAVLSATDEVLAGEPIAPEAWEVCERELGPDGALELVAVIATWQLVSVLLEAWPPDGLSPPGA